MALCVNPPPQGFSQARCSSNSLTLCPVRASCSPHMAPEGPPPMIAISTMNFLGLPLEPSVRCANAARDPLLRKDKRQKRSCGATPSGDGEDHQAKTSQEYSTECGGCRNRTGFLSHHIHPPPLQDMQEHEVGREQHHEDFTAVQIENARGERAPRHCAKGQSSHESPCGPSQRRRSETNLFGDVIR